MWSIHNVFYASLLSPYSETPLHGPNFSQPPPDLINGKEEYEVEQIHNYQYFRHKRTLQYLIKWKGYLESNNTWEKAQDIYASNLIRAYHHVTPLESIKGLHTNHRNPNEIQPGSYSSFSSSFLPIEHAHLSPLYSQCPLPSYPYPHSRALNLLP
jgi:hypothetical protein